MIRAGLGRASRALVIAGAAVIVAWLAGCAPIASAPQTASTPPAATAPPPQKTTAPATPAPAPSTAPAAPADRAPSAEALAVLASIPEPLKPGEQVPPPMRSAADSAAAALRDSAAAPPDTVPTPQPTHALGDENAANEDSLLRAATAAGAATTGAAAAGGAAAAPPAAGAVPVAGAAPAAAAAASDTCWRVQFAAPAKREEAESRRKAAESLLSSPVVIEPEKGLFKVRTRDCMTRVTADRLKERAALSGFDGAFLVTGKPK